MTAAGGVLVLVSTALVAVFSSCLVRLAGQRDPPARVVAFLIAGAAEIVLLAELLSLAHAFTVPGMLFGLVAAAAGAAWLVERRAPVDRRGLAGWRAALPRPDVASAFGLAKQHPEAVAAGLVLSLLFAIEIVLAIGVAPNTYDSLTYHLTRAAYWIQNHTIAQYENATARQATYPVNGEVLQAWVMMMSRGDRLVQLVQFVSGIGVLSGVYGIARHLDFRRLQAYFAGVAAACFPVVVTQSTSTQNDLILSFFVVASVYFALRLVRSGETGDLVLAAAAFGLAIGTKFNAISLVAVLALIAIIHLRGRWRDAARYATAFAVAVLLLGTFNYAQNVFHGDSLTGSSEDDYLRVQGPGEYPANTVRMAWASTFDLPHSEPGALDRQVEKAGHSLFSFAETQGVAGFDAWFARINHDSREDFVGFGPLALFVLFPALLMGLIRFRERDRLLVAGISVLMFLAVAWTLRYNVWILRFVMPAALLGAPLIAHLARWRAGRMWILVVAAFAAWPAAIYNTNKPLTTEKGVKPILSQTRNEQMAPGRDETYVVVIDAVNLRVPKDGRLGFIGDPNAALEYPHFGPHLERHLVKLTPNDLTPDVLQRLDLDALLVADPSVSMTGIVGVQPIDDAHTLVLRASTG